MMIRALIGGLLLASSSIRLVNSERGVVRLSRERDLLGYPTRDGPRIPRTPTESQNKWEYSGHVNLGYPDTTRAGGQNHRSPDYGDHTDDNYDDDALEEDTDKNDDEYYGDGEDYYYKSKEAKKGPADKDFEYIEFVHGEAKGKGKGKGASEDKGKGGKESKSSNKPVDCEYYYYEDDEYNQEDFHDSKGGGKGKGGKGKGGKDPKTSTKSSKSAKKSKICTDPPIVDVPTSSPRPTESNDVPSMRPPLSPTMSPRPNEPSAPSPPSPFTPSPTDEGSEAVELEPYSLTYEVIDPQEPTRAELLAVTEVTRRYLENFMFDEFEGNSFTVLTDFITIFVTSTYTTGMPITIDYMSIARFDPDFSTIIPTSAQLNSALVDAFSGLNMLEYESLLSDELPTDNVFNGATVVFQQDDAPSSQPPSGTSTGVTGTAIAAAAVAFTLLVAAFVIYKRRSEEDSSETDKLNKVGGDMTVAGETFAETYDGAGSVSAASLEYARRYQDEEEAQSRRDNLGTIPENGDEVSVTPAWGGGIDNDEADEMDDLDSTAGEDARGGAFEGSAVSSIGASSRAFRGRAMMSSFEEVALQSPNHGGSQHGLETQMTSSSSQDESSQISDSELSQFVSSPEGVESPARSKTLDIKSLLSFESTDGKAPSVASGLSIRDNSSRRPRTVAEIEALLSADLDHNVEDALRPTTGSTKNKPTNRPRTVEEIENLLTAELDDPLELPLRVDETTL